MRWLSDLINLSRLAIWWLRRMKLNCSQQYSIICILLLLKSFIINRFATKSREFSWDLFFLYSACYLFLPTYSELSMLLTLTLSLKTSNVCKMQIFTGFRPCVFQSTCLHTDKQQETWPANRRCKFLGKVSASENKLCSIFVANAIKELSEVRQG